MDERNLPQGGTRGGRGADICSTRSNKGTRKIKWLNRQMFEKWIGFVESLKNT